jgi:hypothetical protein
MKKSFYGLGTGIVGEVRGRLTSAIGSRYQRTYEERADREHSVSALANCRMCEFAEL